MDKFFEMLGSGSADEVPDEVMMMQQQRKKIAGKGFKILKEF